MTDALQVKGFIETRQGILVAALAIFLIPASVLGGFISFRQKLQILQISPRQAGIAAVVIWLLILIWLWMSYRRFARESRIENPDAFNIRASGPDTLFGRNTDVANLAQIVAQNRLVFLDGESGCGKSALIAAGLIPKMSDADQFLPLLIREWGDDWEKGPLALTLGALHEALSLEQRSELSWTMAPDLAGDGNSMAMELSRIIPMVVNKFGRRILLIADQFDDFQAIHHARFIDEQGSWISPDRLAADNIYWGLIKNLLHSGDDFRPLHLLVVTRKDTSAGLSSVRFIADRTITLRRLENDQIRPLLSRITADQAQPVVSLPENGWFDLRDRIERDLKMESALLVQQLRTILLGLRELPALTIGHYRAAGTLRGVEMLYVARSLEKAAAIGAGGNAATRKARAIVRSMINPGGAGGQPKAQTMRLSQLEEISGDDCRAMIALLEREEMVRTAGSVGGEAAWQLDHDYLARAALAEARRADRWNVALEEGCAAFAAADSGIRQRWAKLLSMPVFCRIGWELARRRIPTLGRAKAYFMISAIKPALLLGAAFLGTFTLHAWELNRSLDVQADNIIAHLLDSDHHARDQAVLSIWRAPDPLSDRIFNKLTADTEDRRSNFQSIAGLPWLAAFSGFGEQRVRMALDVLRTKLDSATNPDDAARYADAYAAVAAYLTRPEDVTAAAQALRTKLDSATDPDSAARYAAAYAAVAAKLGTLEPESRPALVKTTLVLATQPFLKDPSSLLDALPKIAGQAIDFHHDIGKTLQWAKQTYHLTDGDLRPSKLDK